jgi:hypothetical protein
MKKFIALVLFVAMMAMMVPTAAAVDTDNVLIIDDYWYGSQDVEYGIDAFDGDYIGGYGTWDGLKVKAKEVDDDEYEITLTGSYSKVEAMSIDGGYTFAKAVRIPIQIVDGNDVFAAGEYVLANGSGMKLVREYGNDQVAWLYMPLKQGGNTAAGLVGISGDTERVKITVKYVDKSYENTSSSYKNVTFDIVGYAGKQVNNFRASIADAKNGTGSDYDVEAALSWDPDFDILNPDWAADHEGGDKAVNTLTFQIAALDTATRKEIFEAASYSEKSKDAIDTGKTDFLGRPIYAKTTMYYFLQDNDAMALKMKAYRPDGTVYPAGTLLEVVSAPYGYWVDIIGTSNKTVSSDGNAVYYLDTNGCFTLTIPGITVFAASAAGANAYVPTPTLGTSAMYSLYNIVEEFAETFGNGITESAYQSLLDYAAGNNNYGWAYKWYLGRLGLQFTYGVDVDLAAIDIYFQNVEKSSSGISTLGDNYTIDLGDTAQIPFIYNDANAMKKELKTGWASVNSNIASVAYVSNGDYYTVSAKKVGTTYLFCTDINGDVHIINLTVVDPNASVVTPVKPTVSAYTKYVVTASKLNVRAGEGTSFSKVGSYSRNTVVYGIENPATGWVAIYANDQLVGYCSGAYLAEIE